MSQDGKSRADLDLGAFAFNDSFAFDPANDSLPQLYSESILAADDSWLSDALARHDTDLPDLDPQQGSGGDIIPMEGEDHSPFAGLGQMDPFQGNLTLVSPPSNFATFPRNFPTSSNGSPTLSNHMDDQGQCSMQPTTSTIAGQDAVVLERYAGMAPSRNCKRSKSPETLGGQKRVKRSRTKIPTQTLEMLDEYFSTNSYPSDGECALLSGKSGFTRRVIKTWFMNARSRKTVPLDGSTMDANLYAMASPGHLDELDRGSPTPSANSLERYLTQPTTQDPIPTAAIESALQAGRPLNMPPVDARSEMPTQSALSKKPCFNCQYRNIHCSRDTPVCTDCEGMGSLCLYKLPASWGPLNSLTKRPIRPPKPRQQSPMRTFSTAGSESSNGSLTSVGSFGSHISADSRGSRRGRRRWAVTPRGDSPAILPESSGAALSFGDEAAPDSTRYPIFCTWPDCDKSFRYRSEWERHEEACHYCPYHWVCCLEVGNVMRIPRCFLCSEQDVLLSHLAECHFQKCASQTLAQRTFLRGDQFAAHLKRHFSKCLETIPKVKGQFTPWRPSGAHLRSIDRAWKIDNPDLSSKSLNCGFCGHLSKTWKQRQAHVFTHLDKRICKQAWWPSRLPRPLLLKSSKDSALTCPTCRGEFPSAEAALINHSSCLLWSCRYLHDAHSIYNTERIHEIAGEFIYAPLTSTCVLCGLVEKEGWSKHHRLLESHAETHHLRACEQDIFLDPREFATHLEDHHGAILPRFRDMELTAWASVQTFQDSPVEGVQCISGTFSGNVCRNMTLGTSYPTVTTADNS